MTTGKPHLGLKIGALLLALSLSGLYIYFEFRDQPAPEETEPAAMGSEVYPMSKTPGLDLIEALPKSGPIHFDPDSFRPDQDESDPLPPGFGEAPGFDLNDALSKTGTIKADSLLGDEEKQDEDKASP